MNAVLETEQDDITDTTMKGRYLRFPFDKRYINRRTRIAMRDGSYENIEVFAVQRVIEPTDRVLEIGAGLGYMGAFLSKHCKVEAVLSFEANPALPDYARALHAANDVTNVEVRNALLGTRKKSETPFYVRKNFLSSSMERDSDLDTIVATHMIPTENIAHVIAEFRPTALVCDIEGAEADLLPAADLSCLRAAVIELHPPVIGESGVRAVFDAMHAAGLTFYPKASHQKVVSFRKGW